VAALVLGGVLAVGVALRVWGVKSGLPFIYDLDERRHFVDTAVQMYRHGYNPHYFQNPPGFTYLLHVVFSFAYGGLWPRGAGPTVRAHLLVDPAPLFIIGRVAAGLLGVGAAWAAYFVGKRLYGVVAGLGAATLLALAFLPVSYGHLALNDVPTLLPLTVGLLGVVLAYERGTWPAYLLAGAGIGVSAGFKYTAVTLAVPLVVACGLRIAAGRGRLVPELSRLVGAGAMSIAAFAVVNPFAFLSPHEFVAALRYQQRFSAGESKIGLEHVTGWQYYAWSVTWGFGWAPLALAAVGAVAGLKRDWRKALLLLSFVGAFWLFMGSQTRFFARYLLPVYPFLAVLAGYGFAVLVGWVRGGAWRWAAGAALVVLALVQPLVTVVHNDRVLSRADTREQARRWLLANLPSYGGLALDKIDAPGYARVRHDRISPHLWQIYPRPGGLVENYVNHLYPTLLDKYAAAGACTVVTGSIQRDRAFKDPKAVPLAIQYYDRLERVGTKVATFSPVKAGARMPEFNFDWSYDYYPLAYERPGPLIEVYRLRLPGCGGKSQAGWDPLAAVAFAHEDDVRRR
jgi:hypothetical protein